MTKKELETRIEELENKIAFVERLVNTYIPTKEEVETHSLDILNKIDNNFIRGYYETCCNFVLETIKGNFVLETIKGGK